MSKNLSNTQSGGKQPASIRINNIESVLTIFENYEKKRVTFTPNNTKTPAKKAALENLIKIFQSNLDDILEYLLENGLQLIQSASQPATPPDNGKHSSIGSRLQQSISRVMVTEEAPIRLKLTVMCLIVSSKHEKAQTIKDFLTEDWNRSLTILEFCCRNGSWEGDLPVTTHEIGTEEENNSGISKEKQQTLKHIFIHTVDSMPIMCCSASKCKEFPQTRSNISRLNKIFDFLYFKKDLSLLDSLCGFVSPLLGNCREVGVMLMNKSLFYQHLWEIIVCYSVNCSTELLLSSAFSIHNFIFLLQMLSNKECGDASEAFWREREMLRLFVSSCTAYMNAWKSTFILVRCDTSNNQLKSIGFCLTALAGLIENLATRKPLVETIFYQFGETSGWFDSIFQFVEWIRATAIDGEERQIVIQSVLKLLVEMTRDCPGNQMCLSTMSHYYPMLEEMFRPLLSEALNTFDITIFDRAAMIVDLFACFPTPSRFQQISDWCELISASLHDHGKSLTYATCHLLCKLCPNNEVDAFIQLRPFVEVKIATLFEVLQGSPGNVYHKQFNSLLSVIDMFSPKIEISQSGNLSFALQHEGYIKILLRYVRLGIEDDEAILLFNLLGRYSNVVLYHATELKSHPVVFGSFMEKFMEVLRQNVPLQLVQTACLVTSLFCHIYDSMKLTLSSIPNLVSTITNALKVYINNKTIVFKLLQILSNASTTQLDQDLSSDILMDIWLNYSTEELPCTVCINILLRSSKTRNLLIQDKRMWEVLTNFFTVQYNNGYGFSTTIGELLLKLPIPQEHPPTGFISKTFTIFNICMETLKLSDNAHTKQIILQLLIKFNYSEQFIEHNDSTNLMISFIEQNQSKVGDSSSLTALALDLLSSINIYSEPMSDLIVSKMALFCGLIETNITDAEVVKLSLICVSEALYACTKVDTKNNLPSIGLSDCLGSTLLTILQHQRANLDIVVPVMQLLSWLIDCLTFDEIFVLQLSTYPEVILSTLTLNCEHLAKEDPIITDSIAYVVLHLLQRNPKHRILATTHEFISALIKILPKDASGYESLIQACCTILTILLSTSPSSPSALYSQEIERKVEVKQLLLEDKANKNLFMLRMVTYLRSHKKDSIMVSAVCSVLIDLEMDSTTAMAFININGFCDLLIHSIRYHVEQSLDLVRCIFTLIRYFCCGCWDMTSQSSISIVKQKFAKVDNCFDILISSIRHLPCIGSNNNGSDKNEEGYSTSSNEAISVISLLIVDENENLKRFLGLGMHRSPFDELVKSCEESNKCCISDFLANLIPAIKTLVMQMTSSSDVYGVVDRMEVLLQNHNKFPILLIASACEVVTLMTRNDKLLSCLRGTVQRMKPFTSAAWTLLQKYPLEEAVVVSICETIWRVVGFGKNRQNVDSFVTDHNAVINSFVTILELHDHYSMEKRTIEHIGRALASMTGGMLLLHRIAGNMSLGNVLSAPLRIYFEDVWIRHYMLVCIVMFGVMDVVHSDKCNVNFLKLFQAEWLNRQLYLDGGDSQPMLYLHFLFHKELENHYQGRRRLEFVNSPNVCEYILTTLKNQISICSNTPMELCATLDLLCFVLKYNRSIKDVLDKHFTVAMKSLLAMIENCVEHFNQSELSEYIMFLLPFAIFGEEEIDQSNIFKTFALKWFDTAYKSPHCLVSILSVIEEPQSLITQADFAEKLFERTPLGCDWVQTVRFHKQNNDLFQIERDLEILLKVLNGFNVVERLCVDCCEEDPYFDPQDWEPYETCVESIDNYVLPMLLEIATEYAESNDYIAELLCGIWDAFLLYWSGDVVTSLHECEMVVSMITRHPDNSRLIEYACRYVTYYLQLLNSEDISVLYPSLWTNAIRILNMHYYDSYVLIHGLELTWRLVVERLGINESEPESELCISVKECVECFQLMNILISKYCQRSDYIHHDVLSLMLRIRFRLETFLLHQPSSHNVNELSTSTLLVICKLQRKQLCVHGLFFRLIDVLQPKRLSNRAECFTPGDVDMNVQVFTSSLQNCNLLMQVAQEEVFSKPPRVLASIDNIVFFKYLFHIVIENKENKTLCKYFGQDLKLCETLCLYLSRLELKQQALQGIVKATLELLLLLTDDMDNLHCLQNNGNIVDIFNQVLEGTQDFQGKERNNNNEINTIVYQLMCKLMTSNNNNRMATETSATIGIENAMSKNTKRMLEVILQQVKDSTNLDTVEVQTWSMGLQFMVTVLEAEVDQCNSPTNANSDLPHRLITPKLLCSYFHFVVQFIQQFPSLKSLLHDDCSKYLSQINTIVANLCRLIFVYVQRMSEHKCIDVITTYDFNELESDCDGDCLQRDGIQDVRGESLYCELQVFPDIQWEKVLTWVIDAFLAGASCSSREEVVNEESCLHTICRLFQLFDELELLGLLPVVGIVSKQSSLEVTIECFVRIIQLLNQTSDPRQACLSIETMKVMSDRLLRIDISEFEPISKLTLSKLGSLFQREEVDTVVSLISTLKRCHAKNLFGERLSLIAFCRSIVNSMKLVQRTRELVQTEDGHDEKGSMVDNTCIGIDGTIFFQLLQLYQNDSEIVVVVSEIFLIKDRLPVFKFLLPKQWLHYVLSIIQQYQNSKDGFIVINVLFQVVNVTLHSKPPSSKYIQILFRHISVILQCLRHFGRQRVHHDREVVKSICKILLYMYDAKDTLLVVDTIGSDSNKVLQSMLQVTRKSFLLDREILSLLDRLLVSLSKDEGATVTSIPPSHGNTSKQSLSVGTVTNFNSNDIEIVEAIDVNTLKGNWKGCMKIVVKLLPNEKEARMLRNELVACSPSAASNALGMIDVSFQLEQDLLSSLRHPHIITLIGLCQSLTLPSTLRLENSEGRGNSGGIVLEYMEKGDLRRVLNEESDSLSLQCKLQIALDICEGMCFLHASSVIHGDLHTMNILIDSHYRAKISGFGNERVKKIIKDPFKFESNNTTTSIMNTNRMGDVYDFGVILWEMITGKTAWADKVMKQVKLTLTPNEIKRCSDGLVKLMNTCMDSDLSSRLPFQELYDSLQELLRKEIKRIEDKRREVPDGFLCPITQDVMKDPVILVAEGHSYERNELMKWLKNHTRSPLTGAELTESERSHIVDNYALKSAIENFMMNQSV